MAAMDPIIYDNVADVDNTQETWTIRVKVLLRWKQTYKNYPNVVASIDMILIDEQGTKIQATIKKNLIPDFEHILQEGTVRVISDFAITSNSGSYMLVNHPFKINFYKSTKVKISTDFENSIDPYNFPSFGDLLMRNVDTRVAFDVVGLLVSVDPMTVNHEAGKEKHKLTLQLQDLIGTKIPCTLWDSYAIKMNKYISENHSDSPVVMLLHMAKLKDWSGMPQVSNCLFGSKLHINEAITPILSFHKRLKDMDVAGENSNKTTQLCTDTIVENPEDYYLANQIVTVETIEEIHQQMKVESIEENDKQMKDIGLTVVATIINIQVDEGWYYWACRICSKIVKRNDVNVDGHPFNCEKCGNISYVYGKVRVVIRVQDSTGSSSFILFGRLIEKLISRNDAWLMNKIAKDQGRQIFPEELNALLNKKFVFKIKISIFNVSTEYFAYTVHKCTDDESVVKKFYKRSPAYAPKYVNEDGTPTNKVCATSGDNINVIDVDTTTHTTSSGNRRIEMVEDSATYECSSSKADAPKVPKST